MRNLADTVHIRLAAVEEMAVRQVLAVRVGDRRFVSTVLGRTWRKSLKSRRAGSSGASPDSPSDASLDTPDTPPGTPPDGPPAGGLRDGMPYVDWAEHRLGELVDAARDRAGVTPGSEEQRALPDAVRREPALLTLAVIVVAALLLLVSFFL